MDKLRFVTIHLLLFLACSSAFTYKFNYNGGDPKANLNYFPAYQLGTQSTGNSLTIRITISNTATSEMSSLVSALSLKYVDPTQGNVLVDAVNPDGTPFVFPPAFDTIYSLTYPISFPSTYTLPSASFFLFLAENTAIHFSLRLNYFNLQVTSFPTVQGISVGNANKVSTVLKVTDIMRDDIVKLIYVAQPNQIYNFTAFPASHFDYSSGVAVPQDIYQLSIYAVSVPNLLTQGLQSNDLPISPMISLTSNERQEAIANNEQVSYLANIAHYSYQFITPGFYLIEFQIVQPDTFAASITFNSDPYACPFSADFPDYYSNFQPCASSPSLSNNYGGVPCLGYDAVTKLCALCAFGYTLTDGQCLVNTTCRPRQYYSYGSCYNVSQTCGDYDNFTGNCLNCKDAKRYNLANGTCTLKTIKCGPRQWKSDIDCLNVSSTCDKFDQNSGACLSCINLYELKNGSCTLIVVVCSDRQYLFNKTCLPIPAECLTFNPNTTQCEYCLPGYVLQNGTCQAVICAQRQILSRNGIQCEYISSLCGDYNRTSGDCFTCNQKGYTVQNGRCVQVVSPLAGCKERERLGFGPCVGADFKCKVFNLLSGDCQTCEEGYYLDYTGHCRANANCTVGQLSINGQCLKMPSNCLEVNTLGFCTRCINKNFRIIQGQCVQFQTCASNQYRNEYGLCVFVSSACATWNPSNGLCITCKTPGALPNRGVCCPFGQIFFSDKCVDVITLYYSNNQDDGKCMVRHPSLNFCLQCSDGLKPQYTPPYNCV